MARRSDFSWLRSGWRATRQIHRASAAMGQGIQNGWTARGARRGVLGPGDPPPPPTAAAGYYDYRGTVHPKAVRGMDSMAYPLGRFLNPRKGPTHRAGLPFETVSRYAAVVGPQSSGKTYGLIVPWIYTALAEGHTVVTVDVKGNGDMWNHVKAFARAGRSPLGVRARRWALGNPEQSVSWNWIGGLTDDQAIAAAIRAILPEPGANANPFWQGQDRETLRGLLEIAARSTKDVTVSDLVSILRDQKRLAGTVARYAGTPGAGRLEPLTKVPSHRYFEYVGTALRSLEQIDIADVNAVTRVPELDLAAVARNGELLVIEAPERYGDVATAFSSLLLGQFVNQLQRRHGGSHRQVFLFIDEAPRVAERIDLENAMSTLRAAGVSFVLAMQDVAQFDEAVRSTILSNCLTMITLRGVSEMTATYFAGRLGQRPEHTITMNRQEATGGWGKSVGVDSVPVLGTREIAYPPFGDRTAVVHATPLLDQPFLVDLSMDAYL